MESTIAAAFAADELAPAGHPFPGYDIWQEQSFQFDSSFIDSATFVPASQVLTITFRNGTESELHGVTTDDWDAFCAAGSPGKFWHAHLKDWSGKPF